MQTAVVTLSRLVWRDVYILDRHDKTFIGGGYSTGDPPQSQYKHEVDYTENMLIL